MGVLTDFILADLVDAERIGKSLNPSKEFSGLDAKGMDRVKLGVLHCILTGTPRTAEAVSTFMGDRSIVYMDSEDGPWVQSVPMELIERLACLTQDEVSSVAAQWSTSQEFDPEYFAWPPDVAVEFLAEFANMARRAVSENKSILMWVCL